MEALIRYEKIKLTEARAKTVKGQAEKLITIAIRGQREARQMVRDLVPNDAAYKQIMDTLAQGPITVSGPLEPERDPDRFPISDARKKEREEIRQARRDAFLKAIPDRTKADEVLVAAKRAQIRLLSAQRLALRYLPHNLLIRKIFDELVPRYSTRSGGYCRITKIGRRPGDGAEVVVLEFV